MRARATVFWARFVATELIIGGATNPIATLVAELTGATRLTGATVLGAAVAVLVAVVVVAYAVPALADDLFALPAIVGTARAGLTDLILAQTIPTAVPG